MNNEPDLAVVETASGHADQKDPHRDFRFGRTCYDHLAGRLGVSLVDALVDSRLLTQDGERYQVTPRGQEWFAEFGIDLDAARRARRAFTRRCLDWSERRPHLAGALGARLLDRLVERHWIERQSTGRTVQLTAAGRVGLLAELGLHV